MAKISLKLCQEKDLMAEQHALKAGAYVNALSFDEGTLCLSRARKVQTRNPDTLDLLESMGLEDYAFNPVASAFFNGQVFVVTSNERSANNRRNLEQKMHVFTPNSGATLPDTRSLKDNLIVKEILSLEGIAVMYLTSCSSAFIRFIDGTERPSPVPHYAALAKDPSGREIYAVQVDSSRQNTRVFVCRYSVRRGTDSAYIINSKPSRTELTGKSWRDLNQILDIGVDTSGRIWISYKTKKGEYSLSVFGTNGKYCMLKGFQPFKFNANSSLEIACGANSHSSNLYIAFTSRLQGYRVS